MEETFLSALHDSPNDELTWLALADWLDENGQQDRAELVRAVRRLRGLPVMRRTRERAALEDRVIALLDAGTRPVAPEVVNSIGMRLALVPPGRFRMGSPPNEKGRSAWEKAREVEITRPFYLGVFPVTQAEYRAVTGTNPSHFSRQGGHRAMLKEIADGELDRFPVDGVSWDAAQGFLARLNDRPEEKAAGRVYRLPSEAEWEYACRAGTSTAFHLGTSLNSHQANFKGNHPYRAEKGPDLRRPCAVGSYRPNAFGLYDMTGNIWQWCSIWRGAGQPPVDDARVIRGGAFMAYGFGCRAAYRYELSPSRNEDYLGFRVLLEARGGR